MTHKPYIMACGHYNGTEEEWIEMVATNNFKFDVATNQGIGLAFIGTKRRAACRQLLLLPKYLEQTNTSLAEQWNVSEGTIRRWRAEIEKLIKDDSVLLNKWNVSGERLERLKAIIAQETRPNEEGEQVTITRKPAVEDTEEARRQFWWKIRSDLLFDQCSESFQYQIAGDLLAESSHIYNAAKKPHIYP